MFAFATHSFNCSLETEPPAGHDKHFSVSSNERKSWAKQGAELLHEYLVVGAYFLHYWTTLTIYFSFTDDSSEEGSGDEKTTKVTVDAAGNPRLPNAIVKDLKAHQDICQDVFTKAYSMYMYITSCGLLIRPSEIHQARQGACPMVGADQA